MESQIKDLYWRGATIKLVEVWTLESSTFGIHVFASFDKISSLYLYNINTCIHVGRWLNIWGTRIGIYLLLRISEVRIGKCWFGRTHSILISFLRGSSGIWVQGQGKHWRNPLSKSFRILFPTFQGRPVKIFQISDWFFFTIFNFCMKITLIIKQNNILEYIHNYIAYIIPFWKWQYSL